MDLPQHQDTIITNTPWGPLTAVEWHSIILGLMGYWLGRVDRPEMALAYATAAFKAGYTKEDSFAERTTGLEPWYFIFPLFVTYLFGRWESRHER